MKSALITGASSGLGKEFILQIKNYFPDIEEYFVVARREEKLKELSTIVEGVKITPIVLDLAEKDSVKKLSVLLKEINPNIDLLINNAGLGFWGAVKEIEIEKQLNSIDVNVRALTAVTALCLPYMTSGSKIICISSIASFVPNAYMSVYSSTKAYVSSFARALRYELKSSGITVTITCPGPMDTEFVARGGVESEKFKKMPYCNVKKVVNGTLKYAKKGKFMYTPRFVYKAYRVISKLLPAKWIVPMAKT